MTSVRQNLPRLQLLQMLFLFNLVPPLFQAIYTERGLTQTEIGIVLALPWLVMMIADIPTGRLADEYSYTKLIVATGIINALSFGVLLFARSFWQFVAASALWGIGLACFRGIPPALGSLSVGQLDDPAAGKKYYSFWRWILVLGAASESIAAFTTTSLIAQLGDERGIQASIAIQVAGALALAFIASWGLTDIRPNNGKAAGFLQTIIAGWRETANNVYLLFRTTPLVRAVVLYAANSGCTTLTLMWLMQLHLHQLGLSTQGISGIWALCHVLLVVFGLLVTPYEATFNRWGALASLPILAFAAYLVLAFAPGALSVLGIPMLYFLRAMQSAITAHYLVTLTPKGMRATIFAVMGTVMFMQYGIMNVALNAIVDAFDVHGLEMAFSISAVVYGGLGMAAVAVVKRHQPHHALS